MVAVLYFTTLDSLAYCLDSESSTPPPPPPLQPHNFFFFSDFGFYVKIHFLESSKLELYCCRVCTSEVIHTFWNVDCITCPTSCKWSLFCILFLSTVWYTVLVSVLDNHVSLKQLMSIRNLKEWQYILIICVLKCTGLLKKPMLHLIRGGALRGQGGNSSSSLMAHQGSF